ncbi:MAG: hypothetical protein Q9223_002542 [Gallowayella weberi]
MDAIFGKQDTTELFKAENGILWYHRAEERCSAGLFASFREALKVKEYKICVLGLFHPTMQQHVHPWTPETWADLDGKGAKILGRFPPTRAIFVLLLRQAYASKHQDIAEKELGNQLWGIPGRYVSRGILRGLIEAIGDEYAHMLEGGLQSAEEDDGKTAVRGMMLANDDIQACLEERDIEARIDESDEKTN